jgi:hypothetical protein
MAQFVELSDDLRGNVQTAFDEMLQLQLENCELHYPPKNITCNNCAIDPIGGRSSNKYLTGGPMPFPMGSICPLCAGRGVKTTEVTESISLKCELNPKNFQKVGLPIKVPDGMLQTEGFIGLLPKIQRCDYMIAKTDIEGSIRLSYKLMSEPTVIGNIIRNRYFIANWARV